MFLFDTQADIKPIITQNIDGVKWIDENIAKGGVLIFAPDYLSVSLLQMGYEVAFIDYRLSIDGSRPPIINEVFLNQSAFNDTYLEMFFTSYGWTSDLDIYVTWGTRELSSTLPNTGLMIPQEKYEASPWYELKYSGRDEILSVYQLQYY